MLNASMGGCPFQFSGSRDTAPEAFTHTNTAHQSQSPSLKTDHVPIAAVFSGEVRDDRALSGNHGATASAAASASSAREEEGDGDPSTEDFSPMWLRDYKRGMEYEVYSLALDVSQESCLWGLTFSRYGARAGNKEGAIR